MNRDKVWFDKRKSGIEAIGDVPWGTHFCQFYRTKEDLTDILVPYFKAGLENNEFCMWVTSTPLKVKDARAALGEVVKDLDERVSKGQIEILDYSEWYTRSGEFHSDEVLKGWVEKEREALWNGFDGLRLTGNTFWMERNGWTGFTEYEAEVNSVIGQHKMIALCSYSLDRCNASEVLDVVDNHQFALARREGRWDILQSLERKKAEETLQTNRQLLETVIDTMPAALNIIRGNDLRIQLANPAYRAIAPGKEMVGKTLDEIWPETGQDFGKLCQKVLATGEPYQVQDELNKIRRQPDGPLEPAYFSWSLHRVPLPGGEGWGILNIAWETTERKRLEDKTKELLDQIQRERDRLSALINSIPDEIWFADKQGKFTLANPAAVKEFVNKNGFLEKDIEKLARSLTILRPDGSPRPVEESPPLRALKGEVVRNLEEIIRTPAKGELRYRQVSSTPVKDSNGEIIGSVSVVRDITEHKKVDEAFKESEKKYQDLVETTSDFIWEMDSQGRYTYCSTQMQRLWGVKPEEMIGKTPFDMMPPVDREKGLEFFRRLENSPAPFSGLVTTAYNGQGRLILVETNGIPFFDKNGRLLGFRGISRDVTERKKMEEAKRAEETLHSVSQYTRSLIEASLDPIVTISPEGKITDVNEATVKATGTNREKLIGTDFSDYFTEPEKAREGYQQVFAKGSVIDYPLTIRGKDRRLIDVLYNATVYRDTSGNVLGVFAAARDVTDLKKHKEHLEELVMERTVALHESEQRYSILFDKAPFAKALTKMPERTIVSVNDAFLMLFGYTQEDVVGKTSVDLGIPDPGSQEQVAAELRKHDSVSDFECAYQTRSGDKRILSLNLDSIVIGGKDHLLTTIQDITERRRMEQLRDQFISAVTHELRTPLVSIKGYTDYMLSKSQEALPQKIEKNLSVIKESSDRLMRITDDLLDYRRLTMGRFDLDSKPMDLKKVIETSTRHVQPFLEKKRQKLQIQVPEYQLPIQADESRLMQVIMNLLENASKFSPVNGVINLHVERELGFFRTSVAENGIGIKKEDLTRVFEPFAAIQKSSWIKGTGLGLSVTKGLVEAHGGKIWAESEGEGKGSTFIFTIPERRME